MCAVLSTVMCLGLTGCEQFLPQKELSDEEVVNAFMTAYQQGDYEGMKPYISEDNQLHAIMAALEKENATGMKKVYQEVHNQTKDVTYTAAAVEGRETWGEVKVEMKTKEMQQPIMDAMAAAIADQAANGSTAFEDVPSWLIEGIRNGEYGYEKEYTVHVGNRDGNMVMDTLTNREFFNALCGEFYEYIDSTMTTCTGEGFMIQIAAKGDNVVGMIETETLAYDTSADTSGQVQQYLDAFSMIEGMTAGAELGDGVITTRLGINFETASSMMLEELGIISDKVTNYNGKYLSLRSSISGFQENGMKCTTDTFGGSGVDETKQK